VASLHDHEGRARTRRVEGAAVIVGFFGRVGRQVVQLLKETRPSYSGGSKPTSTFGSAGAGRNRPILSAMSRGRSWSSGSISATQRALVFLTRTIRSGGADERAGPPPNPGLPIVARAATRPCRRGSTVPASPMRAGNAEGPR